MRMPIQSILVDGRGNVYPTATAALADMALAAAVRGFAGTNVRMATTSMRLSFQPVHVSDDLRAETRGHFIDDNPSLVMADTTRTLSAGGQSLCSSAATFAVLQTEPGAAPHPLPACWSGEEVIPLEWAQTTPEKRDVKLNLTNFPDSLSFFMEALELSDFLYWVFFPDAPSRSYWVTGSSNLNAASAGCTNFQSR